MTRLDGAPPTQASDHLRANTLAYLHMRRVVHSRPCRVAIEGTKCCRLVRSLTTRQNPLTNPHGLDSIRALVVVHHANKRGYTAL